MKCLIRHGGLGLLLLFCWLPAARGQSGMPRIAEIIITNIGPPAATDQLVRANIHFRPGDLYVASAVDKDVLNLYATGLFENIQIGTPRFTAEGVTLVYILKGKPRITVISFEGNAEYNRNQLMKKVTSKQGEPLDDLKLFTDSQAIETMYEKAGYPHTSVTTRITDQDEHAGTAAVTFVIKETPKVRITEVEFVGAHAFTPGKLAKVIKTRKHWMFSWLTRSGVYKQEQFEDDLQALREFYQTNGYIDFEITATNLIYPTPRTMRIQFVLDEGTQYKVGSVSFKGNKIFTTEQLIAGLKDQHRSKAKIGAHGLQDDVGMVFKPQVVDTDGADFEAIEDFYARRGYLARYQTSGGDMVLAVRRVPNTETGTMDLEYTITEGSQSRVEKIEIRGNAKTKDKVIRRELHIAPGDVFNMVEVRRNKQIIEQLGYFEKVDTRVEADPTLDPSQKDLIIGVDEKSTGEFKFGAGLSTVTSISAFAEVSQNNFDLFNPPYFTGGGQKFLIHAEVGTLLQDYRISFVEPWFLDRQLSLGIDLYYSISDYQSLDSLYDEERAGIRLSLTKALLGQQNLTGTISYNLENVDIINLSTNAPDAILQDAGSALVSRFGAGLAYDTRNSVELANHGQRTSLSTLLTVGDRKYITTELSTAWYFKGFGEHDVLELVGKAGVAQKLESSDVPFYDRLYLGGQSDLRGYDYRGVGPRAVTQDGLDYEPIGGDTRWLMSAEYSFPIVDPVRFALFYDIGNVSGEPFSNHGYNVYDREFYTLSPPVQVFKASNVIGNTGGYSDNYGVGIHINIPHLGPLRLDYGIPIHHDMFNGSGGKFQFGVGFHRQL